MMPWGSLRRDKQNTVLDVLSKYTRNLKQNIICLLGKLLRYLDHHMSRQDISKHTNNLILNHVKDMSHITNLKQMGMDTSGAEADSVQFQIAYPVLSSSCLANLSLQANNSLKAASCWVLKDFFCFLCSSRYDSSVYIGFIYFCMEGGA